MIKLGDEVLYQGITCEIIEFDPYSKDGYLIKNGDKELWVQAHEIRKITTPQWTDFSTIGQTIGQLVDEKNKQYGDSFNKCGDFLKILYPDGVKPEQYTDMLGVTRIFDKLMRIANGNQGEENAFSDIVGYGLLGVKRSKGI